MDESAFEALPSHPLVPKREFSTEDVSTAKLMIKCAARGKVNLLDFEAVDPNKMLTGCPGKSIETELAECGGASALADDQIEEPLRESQIAMRYVENRSYGGTFAVHTSDLGESKQLFTQALKYVPMNVVAMGNLANCEAEEGNFA